MLSHSLYIGIERIRMVNSNSDGFKTTNYFCKETIILVANKNLAFGKYFQAPIFPFDIYKQKNG